MRKIDDALREHYLGQRLDEAKVDRILAAAAPRPAEDPPKSRLPGRRQLVLLAAALVVLAVGTLLLLPSDGSVLTAEVVDEVAYNYLKDAQADIRSDRYEIVQAGLDRLDFSILPTRGRLLRDFELEGGRYCSIRKVLAAQLQMRRLDGGGACTLYVAPIHEELAPVESGIYEREGVRGELWRDTGRLFALAGPSDGGC